MSKRFIKDVNGKPTVIGSLGHVEIPVDAYCNTCLRNTRPVNECKECQGTGRQPIPLRDVEQ
jgi:hypothetical protein